MANKQKEMSEQFEKSKLISKIKKLIDKENLNLEFHSLTLTEKDAANQSVCLLWGTEVVKVRDSNGKWVKVVQPVCLKWS